MEETKLGKYSIKYTNSIEYHSIKREIWTQNSYYFESKKENPLIIDIGSHIGISVFYFKSLYPNSKILAFEPNPITFKLLEENIESNGIEDVQIINKAVWKENGRKKFYIDGKENSWHSNSSFLESSWTGKEITKEISVQTTRLDEYIAEDIDMLKIDTEGSELSILKAHKKYLDRIQNIVVEYHPSRDFKIEDLLNILKPYFDLEILHDGKLQKHISDVKLLTIKGKKRM
ncbi:MAG: FkbM family methyltransferase [Candidatus Dojkabacteria bacterium]|jgi:FkbM family methyltransferase|nr:FkbM family methyltransferase [Candidatus Dojkabacteria bacterium]